MAAKAAQRLPSMKKLVPDLAAALRDMQIEDEGIAAKNLQDTEEWYKTRSLEFNQASAEHAENVRHFREAIGNCKRSKRGLTPFPPEMQHAWPSPRKPKRNTRQTLKDHRSSPS